MERKIPCAAYCAINAVDSLNAAGYKTYSEYAKALDEAADEIKWSIVNSESVYDASRKTFYVSNSGDDSNDGLTPQTAWKTLDKINDKDSVCPDCNILFERGGLWRGYVSVPYSGITYSAYGVGQKPRIYGSKMNYAKPEYWKKSEFENIWYTDLCTKNVGLVAINHSDVLGKYDEIMCVRHNIGRDGFEKISDLKKDFDFHGDINEEKCYLYCSKGNPGEVYDSIELGENYTIVSPAPECKGDIVFDNLHLRYGGCHGIAGLGGRKNVTVQNCVFAYIGGSILVGYPGGPVTGYGNAVEVYGSCDGYYVNANWIYQIYDTAITHQYSSRSLSDCHMRDIEYIGNLCEYCEWSIEFYNRPPTEGNFNRTIVGAHVHHNVLRCGGMGWGSVDAGRAERAHLFNSFVCPPDTVDFLSHNNIYDRSAGGIVRYNRGGDEKIRSFRNTYIQSSVGSLGCLFGEEIPFGDDTQAKIEKYIKEENAKFFYCDK